MAVVLRERPESRSGDKESETRNYVCTGTMDKETVKATAYAVAPLAVSTLEGLLYRQNIQVDPGGGDIWYVTATYGPIKKEAGSFSFSYRGTGGTQHITTARSSVARYPETAKDMKQLIGVKDKDVDGCDIVVPKGEFTLSKRHPLGVFNMNYALYINSYAGYYNSAELFGQPAGTILFLGCDGSDGTDAEAQADYHFAYEQNLSNVTVGDITGINKLGWQYAWTTWTDDAADGVPGKKPLAVYVEEVYRSIDLREVLGFG